MNDEIKSLQSEKKELEKQLKHINYLLDQNEEKLRQAVIKENSLLWKILNDNFPDVVQMIYKRGLRLTEIFDIVDKHGYTIHKSIYSARVIVKDGAINLVKMNNDGCGQMVEEAVEDLIRLDLIPFVERKKIEVKNDTL